MQIDTSDGFDDHDENATISLTLVPATQTSTETPPSDVVAADTISDTEPPAPAQTPIQTLFAAVSDCANLHPDPASGSDADMEEDGDPRIMFEGGIGYESVGTAGSGLPPPMPGSGGWITAENVGEFFDEEGNWRGAGLGPGAGIVREREEEEDEADDLGDGSGADGEETKWRRTE